MSSSTSATKLYSNSDYNDQKPLETTKECLTEITTSVQDDLHKLMSEPFMQNKLTTAGFGSNRAFNIYISNTDIIVTIDQKHSEKSEELKSLQISQQDCISASSEPTWALSQEILVKINNVYTKHLPSVSDSSEHKPLDSNRIQDLTSLNVEQLTEKLTENARAQAQLKSDLTAMKEEKKEQATTIQSQSRLLNEIALTQFESTEAFTLKTQKFSAQIEALTNQSQKEKEKLETQIKTLSATEQKTTRQLERSKKDLANLQTTSQEQLKKITTLLGEYKELVKLSETSNAKSKELLEKAALLRKKTITSQEALKALENKHKDELKGIQSQSQETQKQMSNDHAKEKQQFIAQIEKQKQELSEAVHNQENSTTQIKQLTEQLAENTKTQAQLEIESITTNEKMAEQVATIQSQVTELNNTKQEAQNLKQLNQTLQTNIKDMKAEHLQITDSNKAFKAKIKEKTGEISALTATKEQLNLTVSELSADKDQLTSSITALETQPTITKEQQTQLQTAKERIIALELDLANAKDAEEQIEEIRLELEKKRSELNKMQDATVDATDEKERALQQANDALTREISLLKQEMAKLRSLNSTQSTTIKKMSEEKQISQLTLEKQRKNIEQLYIENKRLQQVFDKDGKEIRQLETTVESLTSRLNTEQKQQQTQQISLKELADRIYKQDFQIVDLKRELSIQKKAAQAKLLTQSKLYIDETSDYTERAISNYIQPLQKELNRITAEKEELEKYKIQAEKSMKQIIKLQNDRDLLIETISKTDELIPSLKSNKRTTTDISHKSDMLSGRGAAISAKFVKPVPPNGRRLNRTAPLHRESQLVSTIGFSSLVAD